MDDDSSSTDTGSQSETELEPFANFFAGSSECSPESFSTGTTTLHREYSHLKGLLNRQHLVLSPVQTGTVFEGRRDGGTPYTLSINAKNSTKLELLADLATRPVTEVAVFAIQNISDYDSVITSCQAIKLSLLQPSFGLSSDEALQVRSSLLTCLKEHSETDLAIEVFGALSALYESGANVLVSDDEVYILLEWFRNPDINNEVSSRSSLLDLAFQYANMGCLAHEKATDLCLAILASVASLRGRDLQVSLGATEALFVDDAVVIGVGGMLGQVLQVGLACNENGLYEDSGLWRTYISLLSQLLSDDAAVAFFNTRVEVVADIVSKILTHIVALRGTPLKTTHCAAIVTVLALATISTPNHSHSQPQSPASLISRGSAEFTPTMSRRMRMAKQCDTEQALITSLDLVRSAIETEALAQILVKKDAFFQVSALLTSFSTSAEAAELCCAIVQQLAGHTIKVPGAVLEAMVIHSTSQSVLSAGISCLYWMIGKEREEGWGKIFEQQPMAVGVLSASLEQLLADEETGAACAQALLHLMSFPNGVEALVGVPKGKGLTSVAETAVATLHASIRAACLGCIAAISANASKERVRLLMLHNVASACMEILSKQCTADAATLCVTILNNMMALEGDEEVVQEVLSKGGLNLVLELLRNQNSKGMRNYCCILLGSILGDSEVRKEAIGDGVLDIVRNQFAAKPAEDVASSNAFGYILSVISLENDTLRETVANDGGLDFVATAAKFHSPILSAKQRKLCTQQLGVLEGFVKHRVEEMDVLKEKVEQLCLERREEEDHIMELEQTVVGLQATSTAKAVLESAFESLLTGNLGATYETLQHCDTYAPFVVQLKLTVTTASAIAAALCTVVPLVPPPLALPPPPSPVMEPPQIVVHDVSQEAVVALTLLLNDEPGQAMEKLMQYEVYAPQVRLLVLRGVMQGVVAAGVAAAAVAAGEVYVPVTPEVDVLRERIRVLEEEKAGYLETIDTKGGLFAEQGQELQDVLQRARDAESRVQVLEEAEVAGEGAYLQGKLGAALDVIAKQNLELTVLRESEQAKCELEVRLDGLKHTLQVREQAATRRDEALTKKETSIMKREVTTDDKDETMDRRGEELAKMAAHLKEREKKIRKMEKRVRANYSGIPVVGKKTKPQEAPVMMELKPMEQVESPEREPYRWKRMEREIKRMTLQVLEGTKTSQLDIELQDTTDPLKTLLLGLRACPLSTYSFSPSIDQMVLLKEVKQWWSRVRPTWTDQYEAYLTTKHVFLLAKLENLAATTPSPPTIPPTTPQPHIPHEPRKPSSSRRRPTLGTPNPP